MKLHLIDGRGVRPGNEGCGHLRNMCAELTGGSRTAERIREFAGYFGADGPYARAVRTPAMDSARREFLGKLAEAEKGWETDRENLEAEAASKIGKKNVVGAWATITSAATLGIATMVFAGAVSSVEKSLKGIVIGAGIAIVIAGEAISVDLWHRYFDARKTIRQAKREIREVGNALEAVGEFLLGSWRKYAIPNPPLEAPKDNGAKVS